MGIATRGGRLSQVVEVSADTNLRGGQSAEEVNQVLVAGFGWTVHDPDLNVG